jgi:hypothetical protein
MNELHFKGKHYIGQQRLGPDLSGSYYVTTGAVYDSTTDMTTVYLDKLEPDGN